MIGVYATGAVFVIAAVFMLAALIEGFINY